MLVLFTFFSSALRHLQEYIFWDENRQWFCLLACNFSTSKHYQSSCWSRWENLDHGQYQFQPIKFVNLVVPSPYETEPYNKCCYYCSKLIPSLPTLWTLTPPPTLLDAQRVSKDNLISLLNTWFHLKTFQNHVNITFYGKKMFPSCHAIAFKPNALSVTFLSFQ